jgi:hypothetical protein
VLGREDLVARSQRQGPEHGVQCRRLWPLLLLGFDVRVT